MPMPLVSVIVPVLNMESFLRRCLDSLLGQTLRDIEIIAIDNGSTDGSLAILKQAMARDPRLRLLQVASRGVGAARNAGLAAAQGEWIAFADADDWVAPLFLARLAETARRQDVDIVVCDRTRIWPDGRQEPNQLGLVHARPANPVGELLAWRYAGAVWNRLFRASLLREHEIVFDSALWSGEDLLFNLRAFLTTTQVAVIPESLYFYYQRPGSASSYGGPRLFDNYTQLISACSEELRRHGREAELGGALTKLYAKHFFLFAASRLLNDPDLSRQQQRLELRQMLQQPELAKRLRALPLRQLSWRERLWFIAVRWGNPALVHLLCQRGQR
jgi:glycosyltransferase EpsH